MICTQCQFSFGEGLKECPRCQQPVPETWELLKIVYPPEDALLKGLLESYGIPVLVKREGISLVEGLTFGPLAEVRVLVPSELLNAARELLASDLAPEEPEEDAPEE